VKKTTVFFTVCNNANGEKNGTDVQTVEDNKWPQLMYRHVCVATLSLSLCCCCSSVPSLITGGVFLERIRFRTSSTLTESTPRRKYKGALFHLTHVKRVLFRCTQFVFFSGFLLILFLCHYRKEAILCTK